MLLPSIYDAGVAPILYLLLLVIIGLGVWQFIKTRYILTEGETILSRSVVPLGWAAVAMGFIGLFRQYSHAFEMIEAAGDISPSIVAEAMRPAFSYPSLGFLCLAVAYVFKFLNQGMSKFPRRK